MSLLTTILALPAFAGDEQAGLGARNGGWKRVAQGVWTRQTGTGATETYAVGASGMKWALVSTQRELSKVMALYQKEPTAELWQQVETLLNTLRKAEAASRNEAIEERAIERKSVDPAPCSTLSLHANAYSLSNGIAANADSVYCFTGGDSADIYARSYAQVTSGGVKTEQTQTCSHSGNQVSCYVAASVSGTGYCTSEAYSSIFIFIAGHNLFYETSASRCGCSPSYVCPKD